LEIHFTEHEDLMRRQTVISAYTQVGNRRVQSRMYVSLDNYRQNYIDSAYQLLKDEVRQRALTEMRSQQHYSNRDAVRDSDDANDAREAAMTALFGLPARRVDAMPVPLYDLQNGRPVFPLDLNRGAWIENYRYSENSGGRAKMTKDKVNWLKEGF